MIVLITIIHVLVCAFLIIVVLLQHGASADIAAAFGGAGSQTAFGTRTAGTVLSRATTYAAIAFMLTSISAGEHEGGPGAAEGSGAGHAGTLTPDGLRQLPSLLPFTEAFLLA